MFTTGAKAFGINVVVLEPGAIISEWGTIMTDNVTKFSGKGGYKSVVEKLVAAVKKNEGTGSKPSVIANAITQIVSTRKPKTRYLVGKFAKPMVWMRVNLGDKLFDKIIMNMVKQS